MADFKTHLGVASVISAFSSTVLMGAGITSPKEVILHFFLGSIGGSLPDIDADHSIALTNLFTFLAIMSAFTIILRFVMYLSIIEMLIIWAVAYSIIRFGLLKIFAKFTIHRGIFHSIPAAIFFGVLITIVCHRIFYFNDVQAWFCGFFVSLGYVSHLVLDELYSIEYSTGRIKWSFGSACKLIQLNYWHFYIYLYIAIILLVLIAPTPTLFLQKWIQGDMFRQIQNNFLPTHRWFGFI